MQKSMVPAIVFGGGVNSLGVTRNLGRNGVPVYCVVEKPEQVIYSKFCKKFYIVPNIENNIKILSNFLRETKIKSAVLFPTSDLFCLNISAAKGEIEKTYFMPLSKFDIIRKLVNKKEFYGSLSKNNLPYPKTLFPDSLINANKMKDEFQYPVFIKPYASQEFAMKFNKKGFLANSKKELIKYYKFALKNNIEVMFQEVIPGTSDNIYGIEGYFDETSTPIGLFAYRRLRGFPPNFGNTCLRESIPLSAFNPQVEKTIEYLQKIKYSGLMEAEWKWDPQDRLFKLLEINARQSMQNTLPSRCGVNLILIAYLNSIGLKSKRVNTYKIGEKWIDFIQDMTSAAISATSPLNWIRSLNNVKEFSYFAIDDYFPWIISLFETAQELSKRFFTNLSSTS